MYPQCLTFLCHNKFLVPAPAFDVQTPSFNGEDATKKGEGGATKRGDDNEGVEDNKELGSF